MYIATWCFTREICLAGNAREYGKQRAHWASQWAYLASKTAYFFCENSLIQAYHPVECVLNLRFPQILAKLFVPLAFIQQSRSRPLWTCLQSSVQTTLANPVLIHFWSTSVRGLDQMRIQFSYKIVHVVRTWRNQFNADWMRIRVLVRTSLKAYLTKVSPKITVSNL